MHFFQHKKSITSKIKDFVTKRLELITQPFEFNQENTIDDKEENLEIEMELDTDVTEKHPENIVVDDVVPDVIFIDS